MSARSELLHLLEMVTSRPRACDLVNRHHAEVLATPTPIIVSRFDVPMEPAPEDVQLFTIGCIAEDGRPVALVMDAETRSKVARWVGPTNSEVTS